MATSHTRRTLLGFHGLVIRSNMVFHYLWAVRDFCYSIPPFDSQWPQSEAK
jgi:hypothetical protein